MIECEDLRVERGGTPVLHLDQLTLETGVVAVMGPNGAGKTTLLETLHGHHTPTGHLELEDTWLVGTEPPAPALVDVATVVRSHGAEDPDALLAAVGYTGPRKLAHGSSGERMLAGLAGALARSEPILLLDEPFSHLDPPHVARVLPQLRGHGRDGLVLLTTHDPTVAARADRVLLLDEHLIADGEPREVLQPEPLTRCYGGPVDVAWTELGPVIAGREPSRDARSDQP